MADTSINPDSSRCGTEETTASKAMAKIECSSDDADWKIEATKIQQEYCDKLGTRTWDYIRKDEERILKTKVGFSLFGVPTHPPTETNRIGYGSEQMTEIDRSCKLIYKLSGSDDVCVAFLFVIGKTDDGVYPFSVIKVLAHDKGQQKKGETDGTATAKCSGTEGSKNSLPPAPECPPISIPKGKEVFIDVQGRVYKDWSDYTQNNTLPKSEVCYPLNGTYQSNDKNEVLLTFSKSPSCSMASETADFFDTASSHACVGTLIVAGAGLIFTLATPVVIVSGICGVSCGVYGIGRSSYQIHDRRTHKQTISIWDSSARRNWLSIGGGIFGVGGSVAVGVTTAMATSGVVMGKAGKWAVNFLNFGSLTTNGLGIANDFVDGVKKGMKGDLTSLEVFQWVASVAFFYNSAVNIKTADKMYKLVQEDIISGHTSDLSKRRMKAFKRLSKETIGELGKVEGDAKIIKGINNIDSTDDLFRLVLKGQNKVDKGIKFNEEGHLVTKGEMLMDTKAGVSHPINYSGRNVFISPKYNYQYQSDLIREHSCVMKVVCEEKQRNVIEINKEIKFELDSEFQERLNNVFLRYSDPDQPVQDKKEEMSNFIDQAEKFAQDKGCPTKVTFFDYSEFICIFKRSLLGKKRKEYESSKSEHKDALGNAFDEVAFDKQFGIEGPGSVDQAFKKQIDQEIMVSNENLKSEFDKYIVDVELLNKSGDVKFNSNIQALTQFYHSYVIDCYERMTLDDYFSIIRETVGDMNLRIDSTKTEEGDKYAMYYNEKVPIAVIVLETNAGVFFKTTCFRNFDEKECPAKQWFLHTLKCLKRDK